MNAWVCTDADDAITCRSHADKHAANMQDKNGNGYGYKKEMAVAIIFASH